MLSEDSGYTFSFKIYMGKENVAREQKSFLFLREL